MHFERRNASKKIIACILKDISPFKMHKIIFFPEKNRLKKHVCLPYLKFSDLLPETHIFVFWPYLFLNAWMDI